MLPLLVEGSVKNIHGVQGKSPYTFDFSNRYSVFDWGQMPDQLENKGKSLSYMAWFFFNILGDKEAWVSWQPKNLDANLKVKLESLRERGLSHHCIGLVRENGEVTSKLNVKPVNVIKPEYKDGNWDYSQYQKKPENALIPLEFIFRFGVPQGSSLMKRINNPEYLAELGLENKPEYGTEFVTPIIEFSTKLEPTDKYLTYSQAQRLAGLSHLEFRNLQSLLKLVAMRLKDIFAEFDIKLWDGKFEMAFGEHIDEDMREFTLVDSIGPDELRLTRDGISLSKENLRMFYREGQWHLAVEEAKKMAEMRKEKDWKSICINELGKTPEKLDAEFKKHAEGIYTSLANLLASKYEEKTIFSDAVSMQEVICFFREYKK